MSWSRGSSISRHRCPFSRSNPAPRRSDGSTTTRRFCFQPSLLLLQALLLPHEPLPQGNLQRARLGLWGRRWPRVPRPHETLAATHGPDRESAARPPKRAPFPARLTSSAGYPRVSRNWCLCLSPRRPSETRRPLLLLPSPLLPPEALGRGRGEQ